MGLLEGRGALVTGGASGIGLATAHRFAAEGARLALVDIDPDAGEPAAKELGAAFVEADVSDPARVAAAFRSAAEAIGPLDLVHLNAGVTSRRPGIEDLTGEEYRRVFGVNIDGVVFGVREAVRHMEGRGGAIVITASIAGINAYPLDPIYAASKHAVVGLVRALAPRLKEKNITINCVCPGIVETPLLGDEQTALLKEVGFPLIPPEEVAEAVVRAVAEARSGEAWVVQPGREPLVYRFRGVPGPRGPGKEGMLPPGMEQ